MAYVDQNQSKEKTIAFVITVALLAAVGYAFVTGLAFNVIKKAAEKMTVLDIKTPPPPPPKQPPPPPKDQPKVVSPPIVTPPPVVTPPVTQAPQIVTTQIPQPPAPPVMAPPAPAPAPKPSAATHASLRGNIQSLMSTDDYPPSALRNNEAGTVSFRLDIGTDGRVTNCTVTNSSGFADLDQTACRLLQRRVRFTPAKDSAGNPVADTYASRFTWQIPKD